MKRENGLNEHFVITANIESAEATALDKSKRLDYQSKIAICYLHLIISLMMLKI